MKTNQLQRIIRTGRTGHWPLLLKRSWQGSLQGSLQGSSRVLQGFLEERAL